MDGWIINLFSAKSEIFLLFTGIRHFALLKLTGNAQKASGTVELYPINGNNF